MTLTLMNLMTLIKMTQRWAFNFTKWKPTEAELKLATSCIQVEEKSRLALFVYKKHFKPSLIGRLMMRKFINDVTKIPYNEIELIRDDKGKPLLKNHINQQIAFNVSHHGDYAVLTGQVGLSKIGCDVMKLEYTGGKSLDELFRLMTRNFSNSEWLTIKSCRDYNSKVTMFCRHWALKESYVKAIGVGITVNLQDLSFKINTKELKRGKVVQDTELYIKNQKQNWFFDEVLMDDEKHCVAVATQEKIGEDCEFKLISFEDLVRNAVALLEEDGEYVRNFFKKPESPE